MKKSNIAVLFGGPSTERVVSIESGKNVINNLNVDKYNIVPIEIDASGHWFVGPECPSLKSDLRLLGSPERHVPDDGCIDPSNSMIPVDLNRRMVDKALICLHGAYGEDGRVQGLLEMLGIPYTGSGVLASALAMSKIRSKQIFQAYDIPTPRFHVLHRDECDSEKLDGIVADLGFPLVVKSDVSGSSIGVEICHDREGVSKGVEVASELSSFLLFEEYVKGTELTCAVLAPPHDGEPLVLPPTEIIPAGEFFDYNSKYLDGGTEEITPARISEADTTAVQELALHTHRALGCSGVTRTDIMLNEQGLWVLELNTIPGMSPMSLIPRAAQAIGMPFSDLLDRLLGM
jgi:D-alanine-D-alanine ligase